MGRKRTSNKGLPQRVYLKHGAYYFVTQNGKWIRLGKTKQKMFTALASMNLTQQPCFTMKDVWKRYKAETLPTKAISSQKSNLKEIKNLLAVFGNMHPDSIKSKHVAEYLDVRAKTAPTTSNREVGLLSHMFTKAIRWGVSEHNPCRGVERNKTRHRDRYVEDWELDEFKKVCPELLDCYVDLKYMTSLRKTDLLLMTFDQIIDVGIYVKPSKTKNSVGDARIYEWNPDLKEVIERIRRLPRPVTSTYLFCQSNGKPFINEDYTTPNFGYIWQKTMKKL